MPTQSECNAIKEKKEKEKKEKEILKIEFENFRKIYPGTKLGIDREFENMIKKHSDYKDVIPKLAFIINNQIHHKALEKQKGLFVPVWKNLSTWINNRCWEEEYTTNQLNTTQIAKQPMTIERYKELFSQD